MIQSFQHVAPPFRLFSGPDSLSFLERELKRLGCRRAVVVCGSTLAQSPLLDLVRGAAGDRIAGVFGTVKPHSPLPTVLAAAAALKDWQADAVIAIGGGSAVVTARAATIFLAETETLEQMATSQDATGRLISPRLAAPKIPNLIVPTTPTTAAVKAGTAVLDPASRKRFALYDPKTRAQALFVHPEMLLSAPASLTVSSSLDTLSLAIEGLISRISDPLADAALMHAVRILATTLVPPGLDADPELRVRLMTAAILTGQGTDFTGAGIATVLGHAIGALHGAENGVTKSIVLRHALRYNADAAVRGMENVATALGLQDPGADAAERSNLRLEELFRSLKMPRRLRDVGISQESLPDIAARGMTDWFLHGNPKPVGDVAVLEQILTESW